MGCWPAPASGLLGAVGTGGEASDHVGHELCALPAVGPLALSCGPGTTGRLGLAVGGSRSGDTAETRARPGPRGFLQGALGSRREKLLVPAKPDSDTKAGPSRHAQGTVRRGACSVGATGLTRASSSSSASGGRCFTGRCSSSWKMALGVSSSDSLSDGGSLIQASRSRLQDTARSHSGSSPCT